MTDHCLCRPCILACQYAPLETDDDLLPTPEELGDLPDGLGTDHAELDEELLVDD